MSDKIQITDIAIGKIVPSPTQPRKHFSEVDLKGLTESIRQFGFKLSAPLVRPLGKDGEAKYEMVAGERRWRAAKAAGLTEIPCIVRELSDVEVLETQLVEYVQHADLTPIEEAEHYRKLLDLRDENKHPVHSVTSLAKRIGKDEDTVRQKLSLCKLIGEAREAVESGLLPVFTAVVIAAIIDENAREKFAKAVLHPNFKEGPLSQREAKELAARDYTRDLRGAPFDLANATLVPVQFNVLKERVRGGACTDCPFRSGFVQKGLPSAKQNICSNPGCYDLKIAAEWSEWKKKETDPAKKRRALSREECDRIYQWEDELYHSSGLVDLSQRPDMGDLKAGEVSPGTWRSLTKNRELEIIVARDKSGKTHELVSRELAIAAAKLNEHKIFRDTERERAKPEAVRKEEEMERSEQDEKQIAVERAQLAEIGRLATQRADFLTKEFFCLAIPLLMDVFEGGGLVWDIRQLATGPDAVQKELRKLSLKDLTGVFAQIFAESSLGEVRSDIAFKNWMDALHVDGKRIEKKVLVDIAAQEKAAAKASKDFAPGMKWITPPREQYVFNQHDVCSEPSTLSLDFGKGTRTEVVLYIAKSAKGWHHSYSVQYQNGGASSYPSDKTKPERTMEAALLAAAKAASKHLAPKLKGGKMKGYISELTHGHAKPKKKNGLSPKIREKLGTEKTKGRK